MVIRSKFLLIKRIDYCLQVLFSNFGVLVLETNLQFVQQCLRLNHFALQQLIQQQLRLFSHRVTTVAQSKIKYQNRYL